jgi:hypothetical protein
MVLAVVTAPTNSPPPMHRNMTLLKPISVSTSSALALPCLHCHSLLYPVIMPCHALHICPLPVLCCCCSLPNAIPIRKNNFLSYLICQRLHYRGLVTSSLPLYSPSRPVSHLLTNTTHIFLHLLHHPSSVIVLVIFLAQPLKIGILSIPLGSGSFLSVSSTLRYTIFGTPHASGKHETSAIYETQHNPYVCPSSLSYATIDMLKSLLSIFL